MTQHHTQAPDKISERQPAILSRDISYSSPNDPLAIIRGLVVKGCGILLAGILLWACGGESSVDKSLSEAETAIMENNFATASKMAEGISTSAGEPGYVTARQAARLSIIYMQLADHENEDTNTAIAVNYCREALEVNTDSAEAYYASVPSDQTAYVSALMAIVQNINNPGEIRPDSIAVETFP